MNTKQNDTAKDIFENNLKCLHVFDMPTNGIKESGIAAVSQMLWTMLNDGSVSDDNRDMVYQAWKGIRQILFYTDDDNPTSDQEEFDTWNHWVIKRGKYAGTWPKRFKSYMFKEYGIKLSPELTAQIGEVISRHALTDNKKYYFELAHYGNWQPGRFQESSTSCWWDSYNASRLALIDNGGGAILFYEDERQFEKSSRVAGIGRAWYWPADNGSVYIFNAYGDDSLLSIARVLSSKFGLSYQKVYFEYEGSYVNGDSAYELYTDKPNGDYKLELNTDDYDSGYHCDNCGDSIRGDNVCFFNDNVYCEYCYDEMVGHCAICGNSEYLEDMYDTQNDGRVCGYCLSRHYTECSDCNEYAHNDNIYMVRDDNDDYIEVCESCRDYNYTECDNCDDYVPNENVTIIEKKNYCDVCAKAHNDEVES